MENKLVQIMNNQSVTTSRMVAEYFGKQHKHVVESIRDLINNIDSNSAEKSAQSMFFESSYTDPSGKSNVEYLMNRDGFSLLVMGFNNTPKVLEYKLKFIEAFNKMEQYIQEQRSLSKSNNLVLNPVVEAGEVALALTRYFYVRPGIAQASALNMVEEQYSINLSAVKRLLPPVGETEVDTLNPTDIAIQLSEMTGEKYTARTVNLTLSSMGLQVKTNKGWDFTDEGKQYGSMYPYENNGHSGFQMKWNKNVVDKIAHYISSIK